MDSRIVRICRAGDQLPRMISTGKWLVDSEEPTLQDVQADSAEAVDVGVVNLCEEADLGRSHGVVVGQEQFELEDSTCIMCQSDRRRRSWDRIPS